MTFEDLAEKLENLHERIQEYGVSEFNGKDVWDLKEEIFLDFKDTAFRDNKQGQEFWTSYQALVNELKERQFTITEQNKEFSDNADNYVDEFMSSINELSNIEMLDKRDFEAVHYQISQVTDYLKIGRWVSKERRLEAWEKFRLGKQILKYIEDKFYDKIRKQIAAKVDYSEELRKSIIKVIDSCHPDSPSDEVINLLSKLISYVLVFGFIIDALTAFWNLIYDEKPKNPLKLKSDALKEIRNFIKENRDKLTREDKEVIYTALDDVQNHLNNAWQEYKEEQQRKKDEWLERQKEKEEKKQIWEDNQRNFIQMLESKIQKQEKAKANFEEIVSSKESFIGRLEIRLENQNNYLLKLADELEELEEKYNTAWNDDFKDRMAEKIEAKEERTTTVKDDIDEIERLISTVQKDITNLQEKIENIDENIDEMEVKLKNAKEKLL